MSLWWRFWHIYRWRALARVAGAIADRLERWHDRLHPTYQHRCSMCDERELDRLDDKLDRYNSDWPTGI